MENNENNENPIKEFDESTETEVITNVEPVKDENVKQESVKTEVTNNANQSQSSKTMNSFALVSFICSLVGLAVCGLPLGIAATITGIKALTDFKAEKENNKWMAIFGLILGIVDIVCVVIYLVTMSSTGFNRLWR